MGFSITYKSQVQGSLDQSTTSCCKRPPPFGPRTGASCHSGVTVALNIMFNDQTVFGHNSLDASGGRYSNGSEVRWTCT
jgi:hypothetical protein